MRIRQTCDCKAPGPTPGNSVDQWGGGRGTASPLTIAIMSMTAQSASHGRSSADNHDWFHIAVCNGRRVPYRVPLGCPDAPFPYVKGLDAGKRLLHLRARAPADRTIQPIQQSLGEHGGKPTSRY